MAAQIHVQNLLIEYIYTIIIERKYSFVCLESTPKLKDKIEKFCLHQNPKLSQMNIGYI